MSTLEDLPAQLQALAASAAAAHARIDARLEAARAVIAAEIAAAGADIGGVDGAPVVPPQAGTDAAYQPDAPFNPDA